MVTFLQNIRIKHGEHVFMRTFSLHILSIKGLFGRDLVQGEPTFELFGDGLAQVHPML